MNGPTDRPSPAQPERRLAWLQGKPRLGHWLGAVLLLAATVLVFRPVGRFQFISYDDPLYYSSNAHVQGGLTWDGVAWALRTGHASNWHPLTWISLMLDAQLFGPGPVGPHLVNLLFHAANTVLLFGVLAGLTGALWRSALVAALFALHPLHVESVAWVSERKDVLSAFFFLLTLWAYGHHVQRAEDRGRSSNAVGVRLETSGFGFPTSRNYWLALVFFALGLLSKPMVVTLPFVLLLLDYWPLQRLQHPGSSTPSSTVWRLIREKLPFFALSAASCIVTFIVQDRDQAIQSLAGFPMTARIENALVSYARYLGKTIWPGGLSVLYPLPAHWSAGLFVPAALLVAGLTLAALALRRRFPFAVTGWFWFAGMLVPVIGLVQAGGQAMADRYTYLPLIGVFLLVAWGSGAVVGRLQPSRMRKTLTGAAAGLLLLGCAMQTRSQLGYWRDSESLFRHTLAVTRRNAVAHDSLGTALAQRGQLEEAIVHFQKSLEIDPSQSGTHNNLGNALLQLGRVDEAVAQFQAALAIGARDLMARNNLGLALLQQGRVDEATTQFRMAVQLQPEDADAHNNLGTVLLQQGRLEEAVVEFQRALELQPNNAAAHNNLGNVLLQQGHRDEAIAHFTAALRLQPDLPGPKEQLRTLGVPTPE